MKKLESAAEHDRYIHYGNREDGGDDEVASFFIYPPAKSNCDGDLKPDRKDRLGVFRKNNRDDQSEDGNDDPEGEHDDGEEENADAFVDNVSAEIADGAPLISEAHDEGGEIVDGADEDASDENPDESGQPSPDNRDGWSDNGACASDAGEVVAENHGRLAGNEILSVLSHNGGGFTVRIKSEYLAREPTPIGVVGDDIQDCRSNCD